MVFPSLDVDLISAFSFSKRQLMTPENKNVLAPLRAGAELKITSVFL